MSRNPRGTGCYDKCGEYFRWRLGIHDAIADKTYYKTIKAKTLKDLKIKVERWREEHGLAEDELVCGKRLTLQQWFDQWISSIEGKVEKSTQIDYKFSFKNHFLPRFGKIYLHKLDPLQLQMFFDELSKRFAPSTVFKMRAHFRTCLQKAVRLGLIAKNPILATDAPKQRRPNLTILDCSDVKKIIDEAKRLAFAETDDDGDKYVAIRNYLLILLAAVSGMRESELLALRWTDIDGTTISVEHSLQALNNEYVLKAPKNDKARYVYIPSKVASELEDWKAFQSAYAEVYKGVYQNTLALVFTRPKGEPIHASYFITRYFRAITKAAGVEGARFHDLRHFFASNALAKGVPVAAVSEQLGHSSIDITLRRYTHALKPSRDKLKAMLEDEGFFT